MTALVLLLGGLGVGFEAARLRWWQADGSPGPGFLPFWLALALVGLSLTTFLRAARGGQRSAAFSMKAHRPMLAATIALASYVALVGVFGYALPTFLFLASWFWRAGRYSWWRTGCSATAITLALVAVFQIWLAIPLPRGWLGYL